MNSHHKPSESGQALDAHARLEGIPEDLCGAPRSRCPRISWSRATRLAETVQSCPSLRSHEMVLLIWNGTKSNLTALELAYSASILKGQQVLLIWPADVRDFLTQHKETGIPDAGQAMTFTCKASMSLRP